MKRLMCLFFVLSLVFFSCEGDGDKKLCNYFSKERVLHLTFTREDFSCQGKMTVSEDSVSFSPDSFPSYLVRFDSTGGRVYYGDMVFTKGADLSVFSNLYKIIKAKKEGNFPSFQIEGAFKKGSKVPFEINIGNIKLSNIEEVNQL